jgi:hypothetical protein
VDKSIKDAIAMFAALVAGFVADALPWLSEKQALGRARGSSNRPRQPLQVSARQRSPQPAQRRARQTAYERVRAEIDDLPALELTSLNVDLVSATSLVLGVSDRILEFRERIAKLPEFDLKSVDDHATRSSPTGRAFR